MTVKFAALTSHIPDFEYKPVNNHSVVLDKASVIIKVAVWEYYVYTHPSYYLFFFYVKQECVYVKEKERFRAIRQRKDK
jgi:hypothetical protein